ncbi:hypothetical protein C7960_1610 [Methanohalophilus euhalobius]|uniref:Uncharacterized protein n=1 Tax=Methanohalophilus euhalobius TaxID=51203 RepID=A0A285F7C9_9EURY|nr:MULTISPECIES: hypothetical protein [Methanohalophilus]ODV49941.1 MAG: hypothetical protein A8273_600 [Methanohalophilus sp. 2-GBenrich]RXG34879.1 hypothetical protein CI957_473 [Methanohalophilus sp. WG1-DM]TCL12362.1 hypothetical protein C7960_1610 [Methanohalophilus euhalobius]SNY06111.1 hypothetical protein SAMN06295989_10331 [Methanohalophilus euhalobius]
MANIKVNENILGTIREEANDKLVADFLIELMYEEVEHPGHWHWKNTYRSKIREYTKMREKHEN